MSRKDLMRYARAAAQAARAAGRLLARHVGRPASVKTKRSAVDLVTEIDRASEHLIHRLLRRACPDFGFLGEERGARRAEAPYRWVVDPLDGTMNFVHGVPLFGVSIGLVHEQTLLVGVIYDPMRKELFSAVRGRGAFVNGRRLAVSHTAHLSTGLLSTGFSSKFRTNRQPYLGWFQTFESKSHAVRRLGSTALSLAYVAAGRLDGFYEQDLWPWDIAAGILLVREAGGRVTDFNGHPAALGEHRVVASNGRIHQQMLRVIRRRRR